MTPERRDDLAETIHRDEWHSALDTLDTPPTRWAIRWEFDPGHGWLVVPLVSCEGVTISTYSFRDDRAGLAYLEEDCDAWAWGEAHPEYDLPGAPSTIHERGDAPCRRLPRFPE